MLGTVCVSVSLCECVFVNVSESVSLCVSLSLCVSVSLCGCVFVWV